MRTFSPITSAWKTILASAGWPAIRHFLRAKDLHCRRRRWLLWAAGLQRPTIGLAGIGGPVPMRLRRALIKVCAPALSERRACGAALKGPKALRTARTGREISRWV